MRDFRYAARQLRQSPAFTLTAVLTLALGIGATTAIFSAVYGLLLESLPFRDAARVISITEVHPQITGGAEVTYPDYEDWRAEQRSFTEIAAWSTLNPTTISMAIDGNIYSLHRVLVSGSFFPVLGVAPLLGRTLGARDEAAGQDHVAVLSALAWQRYFGRDPHVIGRSVDINGASFTIVGVLPPGAAFPTEGEVWLPISLLDSATRSSRVWHSVRVLGRLRADVNISEAKADLQAIAARLATAYPATNANVSVLIVPLREQLVGALRPAMFCLMGAVVLVLFIACANVACILLVRATTNRREVAVRQALGATRSSLFGQYMAQSILLCALGGILGTALAWGTMPALRAALMHTGNAGLSIGAEMIAGVRLSLPVLFLAIATCTATAIVFGLLPVASIPNNVAETLRLGDRSASGRTGRARGTLIVVEIAIAVVVLFLSALVLRSFQKLTAVDPGFRTDHLLSAELELSQPLYSDGSPRTNRFYDQLLARLNATSGIVSAATTTQTPLKPSLAMTRFAIDGAPRPAPGSYPLAQMRYVSPAFFRTLGLKVREGRIFEQKDIDNATNAFVVNDAFARRYLTARNPIGAGVIIGVLSSHPETVPVIGVVSDAHDLGVDRDPQPEIYIPGYGLHAVLLVRSAFFTDAMEGYTDGGESIQNQPKVTDSLQSIVRQAVHDSDPNQQVFHVETMDELLADSLARQRMTAMLLGMFASAALLLAGIGIYGMLSYTVEQRTREIGVRIAVGANRGNVLSLILRQASIYVVIGLITGLATVFAGERLLGATLTSVLFEITGIDPASIVITIAGLSVIAVIAAAIPAIRAVSVNPTEALRAD